MKRSVSSVTSGAREQRRAATAAERMLWGLLRNRRLRGAKFRRQHPVGPYIADFACVAVGLIVEADGVHHFPPPPHDIARDRYLRSMGYTVLRIPNDWVLYEPDRVLEIIATVLSMLCTRVERGAHDDAET